MRPTQPQRVIEGTVDRLRVIAPLIQTSEIRVSRRNRPNVL